MIWLVNIGKTSVYFLPAKFYWIWILLRYDIWTQLPNEFYKPNFRGVLMNINKWLFKSFVDLKLERFFCCYYK